VLLDYHLGSKNGVDLLKDAKKELSILNVPIIILTGEKKPEIIVDCMQNGALA